MMMARHLVVALSLLTLAPSGNAFAQADSSQSGVSLFTYRDAGLAGAVILGALLVQPVDDHYAGRLQDSSTQANRKLQLLSTFVRNTAAPGSVIIGTTMYLTGRVTKHERLQRLGLHGTEALLVGELAGVALKGLIGRQRPYLLPRNSHSYGFLRGLESDRYRSMPSGHTLAAFAAAAAVTSETSAWWPGARWIIGPAMYGGATLAGVSRMYDNRHWASDVIVGAGLGTFAGLKVVRYHSANPRNRLDRWLISASLVPTSEGGRALRWAVAPDLRSRGATRTP